LLNKLHCFDQYGLIATDISLQYGVERRNVPIINARTDIQGRVLFVLTCTALICRTRALALSLRDIEMGHFYLKKYRGS